MDEFYVGKDVTVKFETFSNGKPARATSARVAVYGPENAFIGQSNAKVAGSEVSYSLKGNEVEAPGKYSFVFDVAVRNEGKHTHVVDVDVKNLPVSRKKVAVGSRSKG